MRRTFKLPIKGLSINSTHYQNRSHGMRTEAKEWFYGVFHLLSSEEHQQALSDLRAAFKPTENAYFFTIRAHVPANIYYTREGKLSRRAFDITNTEKNIVDAFCLPKYAEQPSPYGCQNLKIDDCVVKGCLSLKVPADDWLIEVTVRIVPNGRHKS